jgi:hypothetical protein
LRIASISTIMRCRMPGTWSSGRISSARTIA